MYLHKKIVISAQKHNFFEYLLYLRKLWMWNEVGKGYDCEYVAISMETTLNIGKWFILLYSFLNVVFIKI